MLHAHPWRHHHANQTARLALGRPRRKGRRPDGAQRGACKVAGAHDFRHSDARGDRAGGGKGTRPGGLDAPLALAQDPFSGGEIHRLGLLRAWLRDKPVEVLDEPTAFLDATASQRVRDVILERSGERLVLVSSHDPALLEQADVVIELTSSELKV